LVKDTIDEIVTTGKPKKKKKKLWMMID
jgi:hypothetical protein